MSMGMIIVHYAGGELCKARIYPVLVWSYSKDALVEISYCSLGLTPGALIRFPKSLGLPCIRIPTYCGVWEEINNEMLLEAEWVVSGHSFLGYHVDCILVAHSHPYLCQHQGHAEPSLELHKHTQTASHTTAVCCTRGNHTQDKRYDVKYAWSLPLWIIFSLILSHIERGSGYACIWSCKQNPATCMHVDNDSLQWGWLFCPWHLIWFITCIDCKSFCGLMHDSFNVLFYCRAFLPSKM